MDAQRKICVNSLPTEEAWILLRRVVGERLETEASLKPVALKVVEECGGLPLLIQAVANALKDESIKSWEWALTQLQKHAPLDIDEEVRKAFTHLKLSYDYLKSQEHKSCFLLCSLFPEDADIQLEDLVRYVVGLGKFNDLDSIEDARGRVQNAVKILTSSGLLLNVEKKEPTTKMHDVVRDVALLIASQAGNNKFLVKAGIGLTQWLPRGTSLERYTGISLMYNYDNIKLPDYKVNVPHLEIFIVNYNWKLTMISDEFIGCMKQLKVLDMGRCENAHLPQSLKLLTKLRILNLQGNRYFHEISILGELTDLEILILKGTGITEIPNEIAKLEKLRVLDVRECEDLSRITQGVISALWSLEELCIEFKLNSNGGSDCIVELVEEVMSLSKLTYLDLTVPSIDDQGLNSENLKGFVIQIGEYYRNFETMRSESYVVLLRHLRIPLVKWLKKLIEGSRPIPFLLGIESLNNIMPTLYDEGFNKLDHINLMQCPNVSCLVDDGTISCDWDEGKTKEKLFTELKHLQLVTLDKLEVIWKCPDEYISLTRLVSLQISYCGKLKRVFPVSVAQGLVNLKELRISECMHLEEVIYGGGGGDDESGNVIVFPSLTSISFGYLRSLKSFLNSAAGNCSIKYPSLVDVRIDGCRRMTKWGPGIHETPNLKTLVMEEDDDDVRIVLDGPCAINEAVEKVYEDRKKMK